MFCCDIKHEDDDEDTERQVQLRVLPPQIPQVCPMEILCPVTSLWLSPSLCMIEDGIKRLSDDISCIKYLNKLGYVTDDVVTQVCRRLFAIQRLLLLFKEVLLSGDRLRCLLNICARFIHNDKCWGFASIRWL